MALTITYDGYGVVANADSLTNDTGGSGTGDWKEIGGGSYSLSPDASKYGTDSIGSKYASKSGYTYIDGIAALDFSGGGNQEGEMIYIWVMMLSPTPLDAIGTSPYNIVIGDGTNSLNEYTVASKSDSNGWDGRWRVFCIDPTITPTIDGGADLSAIDTIGIWIDTNVSVRAESFFISQIMCAKGLKVEGTSDNMFDDIVAWSEDYANRAAGMFQSRGQTYYSLGGLNIHSDNGSSNLSSSGSNVEYEKSEHYDGSSAWVTSYATDANLITATDTSGNTVDLEEVNVGIAGNDLNRVSISTTGALTFVKSGGYIKYLDTLVSDSGHEYNGVVFSEYTARTLGSESYTSCTFNGSASMTTTSSSDFNNINTIYGTTGVTSVVLDELGQVTSNTFNSSGSNHAVELTTVGDGGMDWNVKTNGFDAGSAGSPVTPTSTGNEDIYISASSGTIDINVISGATTPSIRSAGATVNVIAGLLPLTITVKANDTGLGIPDAHVIIQREDTKATIISGNTNGSGIYTESVAASYDGVDYIVWARQWDLVGTDYTSQQQSGTISSAGADINFSLIPLT